MYGFPVTVYFLSGWLANRFPEIDPFTYSAGHLWNTLLGLKRDSPVHPIYVLSYLLIASGFILIAYAWRILYEAQRIHRLAQSGPYSWIRHPQYVGFVLVMLGVLLAWPAASTLIMFPILVVIYVRLARREEHRALVQFGEQYRSYMASTPAFFPRIVRSVREADGN